MYRALLFDLFHTLVDAALAPASAGRYTADILGIDRAVWSDACFGPQHEICRPTDHLETVRTLAHTIDPSLPADLIAEAAQERSQRFAHTLEVVAPEVLETLAELRRRGYRLALVSNASTGEVAAWPRSPLAQQFDTVIFSCECGLKKPDPAIYQLALDRLQVGVTEALFIGDGGSDEHRGAREAGLANVLITRHIGHLPSERLAARRAQVRHEIGHIEELPTLLERLAAGHPKA